MSSFFVTSETIDKILSAYLNLPDISRNSCKWIIYKLGKDDLTAAGRKMLWLNAAALSVRYGNDVNKYNDYIANYTFKFKSDITLIQGLKALDCLIYQCSEFDREPINLKRLRQLQRIYSDAVINSLPEYNAAAWG